MYYKYRMKKGLAFLLLTIFTPFLSGWIEVRAEGIRYNSGNITLEYSNPSILKSGTEKYTIKRSNGRFSEYKIIATTSNPVFVDENIEGSPYDYYYQVFDSEGNLLSTLAMDTELFGLDMYIYSPGDDKNAINQEVNAVHDAMFRQEFSSNRYAFYFKPGDYTTAGTLNIAYYTHIGGLGKLPYDVKISNVYTPAPLPDNNATCTFWRSAENFTVAGSSSDDMNTWFMWVVSQAAPLRRIYSERRVHYQWWYDGWCSGGFTGDCYFADRAGSWSQQQWYFRNSYVERGSQDYSKGGWNLAYQGVEFGQSVNMADHSDNWSTSGGAWSNVSRVETTPVIRKKPFLFLGEDGKYKIFKPALRYESKGVSWNDQDMGEGIVLDLLDEFYVVKPGTSAETMNRQLDAGKHLFITPGMYELTEPLHVKNPNTIILGTGYATLIPASGNSVSAIIIDDVEGVTVAGLLLDAHYSSGTLLQAGDSKSSENHSHNPTLLADLFFRVGGFRSENVNVDIALEINSCDVIGDHFWIWRADHGSGVGWFKNTSKNGLVVNGHHVTVYGLFNEHFQEYQTLWNGEKGRMYFLQCETPYDATSQEHYMSHGGTVKGYAAYKVADHVKYHEASMMGIYDVFVNTNGAEIAIHNSIEVPNSTEVKIHHACNVNISTLGGINYVINGQVPSTFNKSTGSRYFIIDYEGTEFPGEWSRPGETGSACKEITKNISVYPNPFNDYLYIKGVGVVEHIAITDLWGYVLYEQTGNLPVYTMHYSSGIYFLHVNTADGVNHISQIIKK